MAQSGYEIRLELLKMAKESLDTDFLSKRDLVMFDFNVRCQWAAQNGKEIPEMPAVPEMPTVHQITERAKELNEFINQKS